MYTKEQIEDLLDNVLRTPKRQQWKGNKIQFCCTVHGESHPSCGINIDFSPNVGEHYTVFHCFACGEGGSIPWLVYKSLPDRFHNVKEAQDFLNNRYGVNEVAFTYNSRTKQITLYEDFSDKKKKRFEADRIQLALFKSGKETYKYFFNRGFTIEDMQSFKIGRDLENRTVTIPCFYEDGVLAGIIGRYISSKRLKNERFKIYAFPKGSTLFPLDHLKVVNDTVIIVEGMFDCMMMHKWGFRNCLAIMTNGISPFQVAKIRTLCSKVILLLDNDERGKDGERIAKKKLRNSGVIIMTPTYYPESGKDPCEWGKEETTKVVESASSISRLHLL